MNTNNTNSETRPERRALAFDFSRVHLCLSVVAVFFSPLAAAQPASTSPGPAYPARPIRLLVPFPSGGGVDAVARIAMQPLATSLGQQIVFDNRGGSSGIIATELAARAAPDGYTLFFGVTSALAILPHYHRQLPYDVMKDFAPINLIAAAAYVLVVHPSQQAASVKELIALAKQKPGALNYASAGNGTTLHLTTELFRSMAGIDIVHVPYKGAAAALTDLVSGQIHLAFIPPAVVVPQMRSARLRGLAVTSAKRFALLPELPTIAEAGLPGYESVGWYGVLAPARTPAAVVTRLHRELLKAIGEREVRERFAANGIEARGTTPEQFAAYLRDEYAKWGKVARAAGVKAD